MFDSVIFHRALEQIDRLYRRDGNIPRDRRDTFAAVALVEPENQIVAIHRALDRADRYRARTIAGDRQR